LVIWCHRKALRLQEWPSWKPICSQQRLFGALAVPVAAADTFYVMFDKTAKKCSVSKSAPTPTEQFTMMGQYGSEQEAMTAMRKMPECKG
jgi:hypothetical protein